MGTLIYIGTELSIAVGAKDAFVDLRFDSVEGSVYLVKEADLILDVSSDTANTVHHIWMSVLRDGRTTYNGFTTGFASDIIGMRLNVKATQAFGGFPFETPEVGYLADDPYFEATVRLGISGGVNVAGGAVSLKARVTAERVKANQEIRELMYGRSFT